MVGRIEPVYVPKPAGMLGWDGTDFYALKVDSTGNLVLANALKNGDQLFSYKSNVLDRATGLISGAGGYYESSVVPAGDVWVITNIVAVDWTSTCTEHIYEIRSGGLGYNIYVIQAAFAIKQRSWLGTQIYLEAGEWLRVYFTGALANDTIYIFLTGHSMTKEA